MKAIPYHNIEIEQIYSQVFHPPGRAIALCAANAGEGVTSVALALAERNLLAGRKTLIVDLNLYQPTLSKVTNIVLLPTPSASRSTILAAPQLISLPDNCRVMTGIPAPEDRNQILKLRQPGTLEHCINSWLQSYDDVIIDTSPLNRVNAGNIPAERVAAACDGAVMVVLANHTNEAMLNSAIDKLGCADAKLLGCVFNDRDNPALTDEIIREAQRLPRWLRRLCRPLITWLSNHPLLTQEM